MTKEESTNLNVVNKHDLVQAATRVGCTNLQAENLWNLLSTSAKSNFTVHNTLYYFGALIVCCALTWFLGKKALYDKNSLFFISLIYAYAFFAIGKYLWKVKKQKTLGGLSFFLFLSLIPLVVYAFQAMVGYWPGNFPGEYQNFYSLIRGGWILMEVVTLFVALTTLHFFRFPLLTVILYLVFWFMCQDILPFVAHGLKIASLRTTINIAFGSAMIIFSLFLDRKNKRDFAFWGYLIGVFALWISISHKLILETGSEWGKSFYCALNVLLLVLGAIVERRVFIVFGIGGFLIYLIDLAFRHFLTYKAFPLALSFIGIHVIFLGMLVKKYSPKIRLSFQKRFFKKQYEEPVQ